MDNNNNERKRGFDKEWEKVEGFGGVKGRGKWYKYRVYIRFDSDRGKWCDIVYILGFIVIEYIVLFILF